MPNPPHDGCCPCDACTDAAAHPIVSCGNCGHQKWKGERCPSCGLRGTDEALLGRTQTVPRAELLERGSEIAKTIGDRLTAIEAKLDRIAAQLEQRVSPLTQLPALLPPPRHATPEAITIYVETWINLDKAQRQALRAFELEMAALGGG